MKKFLITVNGKQYEVDCEEIKDGSAQTIKETKVPAAAVQETKAAVPVKEAVPAVNNSSSKTGSLKVESPMPGTIVSVAVNVGDAVKKGDTLIVLEAMKMENEIKAPQDGVVASVNTSKGSSVESGDLLVSLN